jgi:drug/metabolite transporter (DMT)-like permease
LFEGKRKKYFVFVRYKVQDNFCLTTYSRGKTLAVASLAYLTVLFATLFAVFLWDEKLGVSSFIAMSLIAGCGILSSARGIKKQ